MHIDIAQRLHPFSHKAGTWCLVPGTAFCLQVFPALVRIYDLSASEPSFMADLPVEVQGPVDDFTVTLDLEKGYIRVEGKSTQGFFRYLIVKMLETNTLGLVVEKTPVPNLFPRLADVICLVDKEKILYKPLNSDRLSLGNHKAQDWDLVMRRQDLGEIFPFWMRLGQLVVNLPNTKGKEGTAALLMQCEESMDSGHPERIFPAFKKLLLAGFFGLMVPRLHDDEYQGIVPAVDGKELTFSPLVLLQNGACLIRRLFVDIRGSQVAILPFLPPELHCGRLLHVSIEQRGFVDLEWSKKTIRRMIFHSKSEGEVLFQFQPHMTQFRLRNSRQDRGQMIQCGVPIKVQPGQSYLIDKFQK